jgi:TPP-dependent pyruvate/acetoin dehydrogenase alpha subunit
MDQDRSDESRPGPIRLPHERTPEEIREALTGDPLDRMRRQLMASFEPMLAETRERAERDSAIQERIAVALEGIHAEMVEAREHPRFMPTGMMVVKENSAEHLQAKFAAGVPGSGVKRPT